MSPRANEVAAWKKITITRHTHGTLYWTDPRDPGREPIRGKVFEIAAKFPRPKMRPREGRNLKYQRQFC